MMHKRPSWWCYHLNLNLIYKTLDWGRKWLVDFNAGKTQLVSFDWSNSSGTIDVKMTGYVLEEKAYFMMLGLTFSYKLDSGSYIISIAKIISRKIGSLICSMKFLSPKVALDVCISTIQSYMEYCCHNTVVMSGWCSYLLLEIFGKTDMQDCWSFTCCLSWTLGSSLKYCQLISFP